MKIRALVVLLFWSLHQAASGSMVWKTFTSVRDIRQMCMLDSEIWCATSGGVLVFDPAAGSGRVLTNTEGLAGNDLTAVCSARGEIWIGMQDGSIQAYRSGAWFVIDDFRGHPIECLQISGDTLFAGLDIGIGLYRISRQEVRETYRRLGASLQVEIPVRDILVTATEIWAATDEGLAHAQLAGKNLLDPASWRNETVEHGLFGGIRCLQEHRDTLYAGTDSGIFRRVDALQGWQDTGLGERIVNDLCGNSTGFFAITSDGVFSFGQGTWQSVPGFDGSGSSALLHGDGLFVGTADGIAVFGLESRDWTFFVPSGPAGNTFTDAAVGPDGKAWFASSEAFGKGFYCFDGENWTIYDRSVLPEMVSDGAKSVLVDGSNNAWLGCFGGGLVYLGQDGTVQFFNAVNGYLAGIERYPDYAVVSDMALDPYGTLWILNYESRTNLPLIALSRDSVWTYFGQEDGIPINSLRRIAVDAEGRKWFGSYDNNGIGVIVLDDGGTPWDKQDDAPVWTLAESDGLKSNQVTALAVDRDGTMWIGTREGLHYWYGNSLEWRIYLPSDAINDILVDGENNIWVGHDAGLSFRSSEDYTWTHYQAENSGLVSNKVLSLALDSGSGYLYIGTDAGVSRLQTPYSSPLAVPKELRIYPNPFLPARHGELVVDDLSENVTLAVFSADGFLVRKYENRLVHGRRLSWDGRDEDGKPVPGGVYLIVAQTESGETRSAKAALVR
ncbi:hypothetical protein JW906_02240 [bacterium]|nr:hypothetical protein [bacterium]